MAHQGRLAVVVVNYASHELLERNLAELGPSGRPVVVVDNFSTKGERRIVADLCLQHGWEFLPVRTNVGFGAGMNLGVARAAALGCVASLLLNPDVSVDPRTVEELAQAVSEDPNALVCPRLVRPDGSTWFRGAQVLVKEGRTATADGTDHGLDEPWLTAAVLAVPHELWRVVGGFDEDYFLYWEDVDLSWRWRRAGGTLRYRADLVAVHDVGGTQPGTGKSRSYIWFNCRNRLLFAAKHLEPADLRTWVRRTPAYAKEVVLRGGGPSRSRPWPPLSAAARGSVSGLRLVRSVRRVGHLDAARVVGT